MIVEYRFLQVLASPITGDRVTVGLVHWDGTTIRTAASFHALPPWFALGREDLEATVRVQLRAASRHSEKDRRARSRLGLAAVAPVREGLGAALVWSSVARATAVDPEEHFRALAAEAHLDDQEGAGAAGYARTMRRNLIDLGKKLAKSAANRVRVSHPVGALMQVTPPVSWLNGRWHHALPIHLHRDRMERPAFTVVGQIMCAIPAEDRAVVVVDVPKEGAREREAMREVEALSRALEKRRAEVLAVRGAIEMTRRIREKIEHDIASAHAE